MEEYALRTVPWLRIPAAYAGVETDGYPGRKKRLVRRWRAENELVVMRWGLWPFYAKSIKDIQTNARRDSLLTKAIWKESTRLRRCLIPSTGYYEPGLGPPGAKGEVLFTVKDRPAFFMAGLWQDDPDGSGNSGFTMVTTEPNELAAQFHDRMPVVLSDDQALAWIGEEPLEESRLMELCRGLPSDALAYQVIEAKAKPEKLVIKRPPKKQPPPDDQPSLF